jgi:hypothetical protein
VANLSSWLQPAARFNPVTNVLRLARQGFVDTGIRWQDTWGGLVALASVGAALSWFAIRGLRKLDD